MIVSGYYIRDTLFRMETLQDKIDRIMRKTDMDEEALEEVFKDCQTKLYGICLDLLMGLAEATSTIDRYSSFKNTVELGFEMVKQAVKELKEADTLENLSGLIGPIVKQFENFQPEKYDAYDLRSDFRALFKWRHEALLDSSVIFATLKSIELPEGAERKINLLDCYPREYTFDSIRNSLSDTMTLFCANMPEEKRHYFRGVYDRIALGPFKGSNISNEVFDILFLQPDLTLTLNGRKLLVKKEKNLIQNTIKYLRPGGYMVLIMPYFRFYKDICLLISRHFDELHVRRTVKNDTDSIVVLARKRLDNKKEPNMEVYRTLRNLYDIDSVPNILLEPFPKLLLPEEELEIKLFRGSVLDKEQLAEMFERSTCMEEFWNDQTATKLSECEKEPLLPFTTGQIGLVLTSGVLDGVIDEGDGHYHVVKGRVVKRTSTERELNEDGDRIDMVETISNRVEIHAILPDGTRKILA